MAKGIGDMVTMFMRTRAEIEDGDVVQSESSGKSYRVVGVRMGPVRQRLDTFVIDPATITKDDRVLLFHWGSRRG